MTYELDPLTAVSGYVIVLMAITLLCLAGAVVWPHVTAMVAAARLGWMEWRQG